jgi:hypothetical protein
MRDQIRKGLKIQENSQVEAVRLFHPGHQVKVTQVDKYGFLGRDRHPPSDNSLNGHIGKVVEYKQVAISGAVVVIAWGAVVGDERNFVP